MTIKEFAREVKKELLCDSFLQMERKGTISLDKLVHCVEIVEEQAEQERTNFEKWRDSLTVEDMIHFITCEECPLFGAECTYNSCKEALTEWANKRVEECVTKRRTKNESDND